MYKLKDAICKCINIAYSFIFAAFAVFMLFVDNKWKTFSTQILKVIAVCAALCLISIAAYLLLSRLTSKVKSRLIIAFATCAFAVQMFVFITLNMKYGWDAFGIFQSATEGIIESGNAEYFALNPNNLLITILFRLGLKIAAPIKILCSEQKLAIMCALLADIGILFTYLTAKELFEDNIADILLIWLVMFVGFHPQSTVHYSDVFGMAFTAPAVYFAIKSFTREKHQILNLLMFIFISVVGAYIKPTCLIMLVAYLIVCIFIKHDAVSKCFKKIALSLLGALLAVIVVNAVLYGYQKEINELCPNIQSKKIIHFVEMGIANYGYGGYDSGAIQQTDGMTDEEFVELSKQRIKSIAQEYGLKGIIGHYWGKLMWAGTDGTFLWGGEGGHFRREKDEENRIRRILQNMLYTDENLYLNYYSQYLQGFWLFIVLMSAATILAYKSTDKRMLFAKLCIGGLFLFLMIFENRSRYIFLYVPLIMLISLSGFDFLIKKVCHK